MSNPKSELWSAAFREGLADWNAREIREAQARLARVYVSLLNEDGAEVTERVESRGPSDVFELTEPARVVAWAEFRHDGRIVEQGGLTEAYELAAGARVRIDEHIDGVRLVPEVAP